MDRIKTLLLQFIVFLIPANMFIHWHLPSTQIFGKTIDYLLPKAYLSDIFIFILIILLLFDKQVIRAISSIYIKYRSQVILGLSIFLLLLVKSLTSPHYVSSIWYLAKITEMLLLALLLRLAFSPQQIFAYIKYPAILALIFQSLVAFGQLFTQSHLAGFWFLGETTLSSAPEIARSSFLGTVSLLPYGTTPHPNVLAGTSLIYSLWILGDSVYNPNKRQYHILPIFAICLSFIIIIATQSISVLIAFVIVYWIAIVSIKPGKAKVLSDNRLVIFSTLIIGVLLTLLLYQFSTSTDTYSITRRYKLVSISRSLLKNHPFSGTGLNNFIPTALTYDSSMWFYTFPQPVHNIYLLWLTETGFIINLCLLWLILSSISHFKPDKKRLYRVLPLLAIAIIGLLDHYPLTLQTGLLLSSISLSLL